MRISDWSSDVCSSDLVAIGEIELDEAEARLAFELRKTRVLEAHVVVVVDDVEADDLVTARKQALCGMQADESGAYGAEDFHGIYKIQPLRAEDNTCRSSSDLRSATPTTSTTHTSNPPRPA